MPATCRFKGERCSKIEVLAQPIVHIKDTSSQEFEQQANYDIGRMQIRDTHSGRVRKKTTELSHFFNDRGKSLF